MKPCGAFSTFWKTDSDSETLKLGNMVTRNKSLRERLRTLLLLVIIGSSRVETARAQTFEREPIQYLTAKADNPIEQLQDRIRSKTVQLEFADRDGYLRSLLDALQIPISSQMLVYSKTSLQRDRISPRTPRAIYFNDDLYVGYCQFGDVLEISAADPSLGTVFYTLDQHHEELPQFRRQTDHCLSCHGASATRNVPGHLMRSVYSDSSGLPMLSLGSYRLDQSTPVEKRWGGWYVTGTHGDQNHLGNLIVGSSKPKEPIDNSAGQNVKSLEGRVNTRNYLSAHSDLIALMVLEHQVEAHNCLTRANFETREALFSELRLNQELKEPLDKRWDSTKSRIRSVSEALVRYFLFSGEAPLTGRLEGTSSYQADFSNIGPRDSKGRSLREFDLEKRLFRYPCSYLIYSRSFDALPDEAKSVVYQRLFEVLSGKDPTREFSHLSASDRTAILEILRDTKPGLPDYWAVAPNQAGDRTPEASAN